MFSDKIKSLRKSRGLTQTDFAKIFKISSGAIGMWETGKRTPDLETVSKIADYFNVSVDFLFSNSNVVPMEPLSSGKKIQVVGRVPAGIPIEAISDVIDEIEISEKLARSSYEYFGLLVSGESMFPEYLDGDIVVVRKQNTADTGDDVIAYVDGYDATLKRIIISSKGVTLRALNPAYETKTYPFDEEGNCVISIAGIVVEQRRNRK